MNVDGVEYLQGDVREPSALRTLVSSREFDAVVDLLSFTPEHLTKSLEQVSGHCHQYVFVSSATIYEAAGLGERLTEGAALRTSGWAYPLRKIDCERALRTRAAATGQVFTIVRPYITYSEQRVAFGVWEGEEALSRIRAGRQVVIGNEVARSHTSLTHSRDLSRGIVALCGNPRAVDEVFHIANDYSPTWREVYEVTAEILGVRLDVVSAPASRIVDVFPELAGKVGDRMLDRRFDLSKFRAACPGFEFEYTLREGYLSVMGARGERPLPGALWRGRMDRLVGDFDILRLSADSRSDVDSRSISQRLRYVVGRSRLLYTALRWLTRRRTQRSNYAVG